MAALDDLFAQIPVQDIAAKLGADQTEVTSAIQTLVPALVGGLAQNAQDDDAVAGKIENAAQKHAASGLLDGGVTVDDVDEDDGDKIVANIFGGNNSGAVASALAGTGAGGGDLIKRLLPILAPIVLAYIGKQFSSGQAAPAGAGAPASAPAGGIGDLLGSILGGGGGGGNNPLGSILGSVLGGGSGGQSNPIGEILGGLLGGKK